MSVRLHGTTWLSLYKFSWNLKFEDFQNSADRIKFNLNLTRIMDTLCEDPCSMMMPCWLLLRMRKIADKICRDSKNTHFMFNNVEKYCTAKQDINYNIIWQKKMQFSCQIPKARIWTHTIIFNSNCFSIVIMVSHTHLNIMLYVHCLSCCNTFENWDMVECIHVI